MENGFYSYVPPIWLEYVDVHGFIIKTTPNDTQMPTEQIVSKTSYLFVTALFGAARSHSLTCSISQLLEFSFLRASLLTVYPYIERNTCFVVDICRMFCLSRMFAL